MTKRQAGPVAILSMYDWPEVRSEVDAHWAMLRDELRKLGVAAPELLVRSHGELPAVAGGIRDSAGRVVAPDPASLAPDEFDPHEIWMHPDLLFAQTCWGPMETGLSQYVQLIAQPNYDGVEGGAGELYSSAIIMRAGEGAAVPAPPNGKAILPLDLLRGRRFTFNEHRSMSGILALTRDLAVADETLGIFSSRIQSGAHRASIRSVANGDADVAAIDCKSLALAMRHEPAAGKITVVGWTKRRKGLPFITSRHTPQETVSLMRTALQNLKWV